MIDQLTEGQQRALVDYCNEIARIMEATGPADMEAASRIISLYYADAGLPPPEFIHCSSPLAAVLAQSDATVRDTVWDAGWPTVGATVRDTVRDAVRPTVRATAWDTVGATVRTTVGTTVRTNVWDAMRDAVEATAWDTVWASVWDAGWATVQAIVRATVGDAVWDAVQATAWDAVGAFSDARWIGYYRYNRDILGVEYPAQANAFLDRAWELSQAADWWIPYRDVCYVIDRPDIIRTDDRKRLHCDDGPAIAFADGFKIWHIHGVAVTEQIVMHPETLTPEQIDREPNAEVRRVMVDRFGLDRYMADATLIDDDVWGKLFRKGQPNDEPIVAVQVVDPSTGRVYHLRVPPDTQTALQGVAWTFGMSAAEYADGKAKHS